MTTVFIAGSISISHLHQKVQERIGRIVSSELDVVVGDADGADTSIQKCLHHYGAQKVIVYCTGEVPRNNVAEWPVHKVFSKAKAGSRAYFTAKDLEMAQDSNYGLMIWDCKSTGTLSNVIELLKKKKKTVVFVNKKKDFITVSDKAGLDRLLTFMTPNARLHAEDKIQLSSKIAGIGQEQFALDIISKEMPSSGQDGSIGFMEAQYDDVTNVESMKLRSELMSALKEHISRAHLSQSEAAKLFGVTQPRISDLTRGKADLFGLDALVNMAAKAGLRIEMQVRESM